MPPLSNKHLHCYVNEFAGRHNARKDNTADIIAAQARSMAGKRLTYDGLISGSA